MDASDTSPQALGQALVDALKQRGDLTDARVEAAFLAVPRHEFLPDLPLDKAYADEAVAVKRDSEGVVISSCSQPSMIALMLHQLQLRPGHRVLEIGTGTGYNSALIKHIVSESGQVTTVELDSELVEQAADNQRRAGVTGVHIVHDDGALGYPPNAPYDRIVATAGIWDMPLAWIEQLKPGGIVVAPIWLNAFQVSAMFTLQPDGTLYSHYNPPCGFIHMRGVAAGPALYARVGDSGLLLAGNDVTQLDLQELDRLLSNNGEVRHLGFALTSADYWHGFLPYLILNVPAGYTFAGYAVGMNQQAYGIEGHGFALVGADSTCFVPYRGQGEAYCYGGPGASQALRHALKTWDAQGRPGGEKLRLRLLPIEASIPAITTGVVFPRWNHNLLAWLDMGGHDHP